MKFFVAVLLFIALFAVVSAADLDKCETCKFGCMFLKPEHQKVCEQGCKAFACKSESALADSEAEAAIFKKLWGTIKEKAKNWWSGCKADPAACYNQVKGIVSKFKNDKSLSDAEFKKFLSKAGKIAKKGLSLYMKGKSMGILADSEAEALFFKQLWGKVKEQAKNWWSGCKADPVSCYNQVKGVVSKFKGDKAAALSDSDAAIFKKLWGKVKEQAKNWWSDCKADPVSCYKQVKGIVSKFKNDKSLSDSEFKKFLSKAGKIAKKGIELYKKGKEMGILADSEAEALFFKQLWGKVKEQAKNWWSGCKADPVSCYKQVKGVVSKFKGDKSAALSDAAIFKQLWGKVKEQAKNWWSGCKADPVSCYKQVKGVVSKFKGDKSLSDAEFKKFLSKAGKIAKKGFELYKKGKAIGILADSEAEALFFKQLWGKVKEQAKNWWSGCKADPAACYNQVKGVVSKFK